MSKTLLDELQQHKIIAILRGVEPHYSLPLGQAIVDGGIKFMEITMNTEGAEAMISEWKANFAGQAHIGAGTVIDLDHAKRAIAAGAEFLISPNLDIEAIKYAQEHNVPMWPGVMTPTEIITAMKAGVDAVKLFPMASLGVNYLREVRGPINKFPFIATGGVQLDNIRDYFAAGANAVGMGGKLVDLQLAREGKFAQITENIKKHIEAISDL